MKVFLTGATGFVGSHLLPQLLQGGHQVRALMRHDGARKEPSLRDVEAVVGDVNSPDLAQKMAGCDAVINLVGIIYEHGKETFQAVHHEGTKSLVAAGQQNRVRRFVQMSALGARPGDASPYHVTKFAAEEEVRSSGIPWVVLRPSLIFGPGSAFVQQMVAVMRALPLIQPVAGTGKYRFRPVSVHDVAECFVQALTNPASTGKTIDLVGGEELTLDEIAAEISECMGVRKTPVHIPISLMRIAARIFSLLPTKPPVTTVQLRMLEEGSVADPEPMKRVFAIEPIGFRAGLSAHLSR